MALKPKKKSDFGIKIKGALDHGQNVVFIKGGSTLVEDKWVHFKDLRIDIQKEITNYVQSTSRRIFNHFNDVLYALMVLDKTGKLEVIPSISYNKKSFGDIKVFPDLSGKLPLALVRLTQDGSSDLKAFKTIRKDDIEVYQGYGNFTTRGAKGEEGIKGITGIQGLTGIGGLQGNQGETGLRGETGLPGSLLRGETGPEGSKGATIPTFIVDRS